jgi:cysteine desulfurase
MTASSGMRRIYLDYNASTPIDPRVWEAMCAAGKGGEGNPSSTHWAGAASKEVLERGRLQIASVLGCSAEEVVLTSGGSEANNLALKGVYFARGAPEAHLITTQVEHPSILSPCAFLERLGAKVTYLPVDRTGRVDPEDLQRAITSATVLISVMHANNEVGTVQPIEACARIAHEHDILFHTDAAQTVGKISTCVDALGVDLLSIAGHKLYAPKGVGALYVRAGTRLEPLIHGAGHEHGRRAGTESALLAAGLGAACEIAGELSSMGSVRELRDGLWSKLRTLLGEAVVLNGHPEQRLPNTLNVSFLGHVGADVLSALEGIAASTGSACHSGRVESSPVLRAMGIPEEIGMGAIRFSLGRSTTADEIAEVAERVASVLH